MAAIDEAYPLANHQLPSTAAPRLIEQVRTVIRLKHYSLRTEESYVQWIRRFILYHGKRHPREMGAMRSPVISAISRECEMFPPPPKIRP